MFFIFNYVVRTVYRGVEIMTEMIAIGEGDIVTLLGDSGEWLVESFPNSEDGDITYYNESTGDFIQLPFHDGLRKIDRVIRKAS